MKILVVNWQDIHHPFAGGAEIHLHALLSRLVAWGHDVHLVCSGFAGGAPHAEQDGMRVTRVGGRRSFALRGRRAIAQALVEDTPDIVIEDINKLPLYTPRMSKIPSCVIVPHLFGATAFTEASWPVASIVWLAERWIPTVYRQSGFHAISESTRDDLIARGIPTERIRVIHPGVDATFFSPGTSLDRSPEPSFLFVGRLKRYKGVDTALRAMVIARRTRPELTLQIAGTGDDSDRLIRLAARLGLGSTVTFLGTVPEDEKVALFRRSWANILPSAKEGWGMTIIEAGACGTPSIASDRPGLRDSVIHEQTGFLVTHGDAEELADRMLTLAGAPALVEQLGANARAHAERLTWDEAARKTESQLQNLIAASPIPTEEIT